MTRFAYIAFDANGKRVRGDIEADDQASALERLARKNVAPVDLRELGAGQVASAGPWWSREISLTGPRGLAARPDELERFFAGFATMLRARFTVLRTLEFCRDQARTPKMKRALAQVGDAVANGTPLARALEAAVPVLPQRFVAIIGVGERANRLDDAAERAAAILASETRMARELRSAMIYPLILVAMSLLVLSVVTFYLTPTLLPVFAAARAPAPTLLRLLDGLRVGILTGWPVALAAAAAVLALGWTFAAPLRAGLAIVLLRMPATGPYLKKRETLRIVQAMAIMLQSGARLSEAIAAARDIVSLPPYRTLMQSVGDATEQGAALADSLAASPLIDDLAVAMIRAGEESNRLAPLLGAAAETLESELAVQLSRAIRMLTPVLTLLIGVGVGAIVLSTITAILDLNDVAF